MGECFERQRFNIKCRSCGHVWTSFFMPILAEKVGRFRKVCCPMCFDTKPVLAAAHEWPHEVIALSLLTRAVDAMSRTEPNGVSTAEWDAIIAEGKALLDKAVR